MNKLMAVGGLASVLIVLIVLAAGIGGITGFVTAEPSDEKKSIPDFKLYTKARCVNGTNFIRCFDELVAECNGIRYIVRDSRVKGEAVFEKGWEDPRD